MHGPGRCKCPLIAGTAAELARSVRDNVGPACPQSCLTQLDLGRYASEEEEPNSALGEMQKQLATNLRKCPRGLVLVQGLQAARTELLGVLHAITSEQGQLEQDGRSIPTHGATALLIAGTSLPLRWDTTEEAFKVAARSALTQILLRGAKVG